MAKEAKKTEPHVPSREERTQAWLQYAAVHHRPIYWHELPTAVHCPASAAFREHAPSIPTELWARSLVAIKEAFKAGDDRMSVLARYVQEMMIEPSAYEMVTMVAQYASFERPPGSAGPILLAYMADGRVERVFEEDDGTFRDLPGALFITELDFIWAEPEPLAFVAELAVCPPESTVLIQNLSLPGMARYVRGFLRASTLALAAKWTGAQRGKSTITKLTPGHGWPAPVITMGERQITNAEQKLRRILGDVAEYRAILAKGGTPPTEPGPYCDQCGSILNCSTYINLAKQLVDSPKVLLGRQDLKLGDYAAECAQRLIYMERLAWQIRGWLRSYTRKNNAVPLKDDSQWGPRQVTRRAVKAKVAVEQYRDLFPWDVDPLFIVTFQSLSKAVERAVQKNKKLSYEAEFLKLVDRIEGAGGITEETTNRFGRHYPDDDSSLEDESNE